MWPRYAQMTSLWDFFFIYIFFYVSEVQTWRPRLHPIRFSQCQFNSRCRSIFSPTDGGAELPQTFTGSRGNGRKSVTGVRIPTQTSGQTRRCCLLTVSAQRAGGRRKPFRPWHHFTALFDSCLWLKVKSGIRVEPGPRMPWNENLLTQFSLQQLQ